LSKGIQKKKNMAFKTLLFVFLALFFATVNAHLCTLNPVQRGSAQNLTVVGTADCFLVNDPPCGGLPAQMPQTLIGGTNLTFAYLYNEDHYNKTNPGNTLYQFVDTLGNMYPVFTVQDFNPNAPYIYTISAMVPSFPYTWSGYLQGIWTTNIGLTFYQCSDVVIVPNTQESERFF